MRFPVFLVLSEAKASLQIGRDFGSYPDVDSAVLLNSLGLTAAVAT
jgi:hypothetical protein